MSTVTAVPLQPVKRGYLIWLWLGVALAVVGAVLLARQGDDFLVRNSRGSGVVTSATGLQKRVLTPGKGGPHPTDADVALIMYEGKLLDGTTFDKQQQPTPMPVAGVVPGFSEALKSMNKGEKARFWLPPSLAYGDRPPQGAPIPPNSTLVFDVELIDFLPEQVIRQMQAQQGMMGGGAPGGSGGMPGGPGGLPGGPGGMPQPR